MTRMFFMFAGLVMALTAEKGIAETEIAEPALFARLSQTAWHRVLDQDALGVTLSGKAQTFDEVWGVDLQDSASQKEKTMRRSWDSLLLPLPDPEITVHGYAMTYRGHQKEVRLKDSIRFLKQSKAVIMSDPIRESAHLDYELEIGILIHRGTPERFGFVLTNDLTDREIQVHKHDPKNLAPGFSESKSFEGALRVGPLLAVGGASMWPKLHAELKLNGEIRQQLRASDCIVSPAEVYRTLFASDPQSEWLLALAGTPEGVIFRAPNWRQKIALFMTNGFSLERVKEDWLNRFTFLIAGDEIEIESPRLGYAKSRVIAKK